jgi:RND family efflux transporter MFP subunit
MIKGKMGLCLFIVAVLCLGGCSRSKEPVVIQYVALSLLKQGPTRSFPGELVSVDRHTLSFPIGGIVDHILVAKHSMVVKGQILLRLEADALKHAYMVAQSQLENTQNQLKDSLKVVNLAQQMQKAGAGTEEAYDQAAQKYNDLQEAVHRDEAAVQKTEAEYNQAALRSPVDGFVADVKVLRGNYVGEGQPLLIIDAKNSLRISINLPKDMVDVVALSDPTSVNIPVLKRDAFPGVIDHIEPLADGGVNAMVNVIPQTDLRFNQQALVYFSTQDKKNPYWTLPQSAVSNWAHADKAFVYLYYPEQGITRIKHVRVRSVDKKDVQVEGLMAGDRVITEAQGALSDGAQVTAVPASALPQATEQQIHFLD